MVSSFCKASKRRTSREVHNFREDQDDGNPIHIADGAPRSEQRIKASVCWGSVTSGRADPFRAPADEDVPVPLCLVLPA